VGVAFEVPDRRAQRRFAAQREGFEERELAPLGTLLREEDLHGLPRSRNQVGGAALDQVKQGVGASGRHPGQHRLPVEQATEGVV
jgi:hypothetical protein